MIALLGACEVVADFDRDKLDEQRTIDPTPMLRLDGAIAQFPEAGAMDGALIGPGSDDAGLDARAADASNAAPIEGLDSSIDRDGAVEEVDPDPPDATTEVTTGN